MSSSLLRDAVGIGFKPQHFAAILESPRSIDFFEIHAENYMGAGGPPHAQLTRLRRDYPLSVHGVGLSLGGEAPLDATHLSRLKAVCDRYQPDLVSEHLAWSSHDGAFLNDLLPMPLTSARLARLIAHVDQVQQALQRQILIENPATYLRFAESTVAETEFLAALSQTTGCGLLLDINNVHVSAQNHGSDASAYLAAFPIAAVGEIHLAGHAVETTGSGAALLIDTHGEAIAEPVLALYAEALRRAGPLPTLIERDNNIPDWPVLVAESARARSVMGSVQAAAEERAA